MGNRAVITTRKDLKDIGVYLHWNGGRDSVEGFLTYCKIKGFRPPEHDNYGWAYLCVTIGNFFGGEGFSLGIDVASKLDCDNWDNGTYIIKTGYTVKSCHDLYHAETAAKATDVPFRAYGKQCKRKKPSENAQDVSQKAVQPDNPDRNDEEPCDDADSNEKPTEEELQEAAEPEEDLPLPAMPEKVKAVQMQGSPFYQRYMQVQNRYPEHIVLFSRGDFYEALGKGAQILAENLALTITSRDCGLLERVPMVGVPHYAVDNYIVKALEGGLKIVLADSSDNVKVYPQRPTAPKPAKAEETPVRNDPPAEDGKHWLDEKTYVDDDGIVHNTEEETDCEDDEPVFDMSAYDTEALAVLDELFGNEIILR